MSKTLDAARAYLDEHVHIGHGARPLEDIVADFADKIAADAVRAERERLLKDLAEVSQGNLDYESYGKGMANWLNHEFAAELKEGE